MLQLLGWILLAIIVAGGLCALAVVFLPAGEQIAPAVRDEPVWELPAERELRPEDVDSVRLPVALRGYRFAETDLLLDRLAEEIRSRDVVIARLSQTVAPTYSPTGRHSGTPDASEENQAEEPLAEDAPVEDAPAEDAPAEDAPVEQLSVEDAPVEQASDRDERDRVAAVTDDGDDDA